jgi:glycosyltransferase involved in cell wall biosynthesis
VVVHTEHGQTYANRLRTRILGRLAGRFVARFFCVSRDIANEVATCRIVPSDKIAVVANGIDTAAFDHNGDPKGLRLSLGIPVEAPLVGTVGRLSEIKRQDLLVRAVARLEEAHLLLVGDGPLEGSLRALAKELGAQSRVHFAGYQARPEAYLRAMDGRTAGRRLKRRRSTRID